MILLVLAAGKGSRYGGPKQIDPLFEIDGVDKTLLHFSLENSTPFFQKYIFVVREEIRLSFEKLFEDFMETHNTEIVIQDSPLGTAYPIICAYDKLDDDFAVINADDYYGKESFGKLYDHFHPKNMLPETCMIGYKLGNTLSPNGPANRGICKLTGNYLSKIEETKGITHKECKDDHKTIVSMNFFAFKKKDLNFFRIQYLLYMNVYERDEFMLPDVVNHIIKYKQIKVIKTDDIWVGLTYKEDKKFVIDFLKNKK